MQPTDQQRFFIPKMISLPVFLRRKLWTDSYLSLQSDTISGGNSGVHLPNPSDYDAAFSKLKKKNLFKMQN
jgi:hypothetical protein